MKIEYPLHPNNADKYIRDLEKGEIGYIAPWAIRYGNGWYWLECDDPCTLRPDGSFNMEIELNSLNSVIVRGTNPNCDKIIENAIEQYKHPVYDGLAFLVDKVIMSDGRYYRVGEYGLALKKRLVDLQEGNRIYTIPWLIRKDVNTGQIFLERDERVYGYDKLVGSCNMLIVKNGGEIIAYSKDKDFSEGHMDKLSLLVKEIKVEN